MPADISTLTITTLRRFTAGEIEYSEAIATLVRECLLPFDGAVSYLSDPQGAVVRLVAFLARVKEEFELSQIRYLDTLYERSV
jgi:hypothetical protein